MSVEDKRNVEKRGEKNKKKKGQENEK